MSIETIKWKLPWRAIQYEAEIPGVQDQLNSEITDKHPLWGTKPIVIGRRVDCDDVLAELNDGTYANIHLVWGSGPGAFPEQYPTYIKYNSLPDFAKEMEQDALAYEE
jgi:hypothetical protein